MNDGLIAPAPATDLAIGVVKDAGVVVEAVPPPPPILARLASGVDGAPSRLTRVWEGEMRVQRDCKLYLS